MRIAAVLATTFLGCAMSLLAVTASADGGGTPQAEKAPDSKAEKSTDTKEETPTAPEQETVRTKSGLEYTELVAGTGAQPKRRDTVKVHYHGTFANGKVFDSSVDRGKPAKFRLNQVISCWTEGVAMMREGGKARLVCPPGIAYGDRGHPPKIPPNATLTFEVELLKVMK